MRGDSFESYNQQTFEELIGRKVTFVQDNHSKSKKNVLRGLHFQRGENAQGKLVRCAVGEVLMLRSISEKNRLLLVNGLV